MRSENTMFLGEEAREALQAICDKLGFTLVEDVYFKKQNGQLISISFDVEMKLGDTTLLSAVDDNADCDVCVHRKWVNSDVQLFSDDIKTRDDGVRAHLNKCCREVLVKMLGRFVIVHAFDDVMRCESVTHYEIPDASSVEELKLKLELM